MLQFLFDTDHLTLFHHGHIAVRTKMALQPADAVGLSVIAVEEEIRGRLSALSKARTGTQRILRYALLMKGLDLVRQFPIASYDQAAENVFQQLCTSRIRIGTQDLKIAAVALVNNVTLLTRNRRDFGRVPGLALDDWSV